MAQVIFDEATQAQVIAADPERSTWLSANAGSGKTRVLTDRVARLLLDGVRPDHILCLTYTKAAATEMQNRLFTRLGGWAMSPDKALREDLLSLGETRDIDALALKEARTLFARAIETPGGLRIQTIHSFCASLLRRFPLEAGVSPQFREIEDRAAELLRLDILDQMVTGSDLEVVTNVARYETDESLEKLAQSVSARAPEFEIPLDLTALRSAYGLAEGVTETTLADQLFSVGTLDFFAEVAAVCLSQGSKNDKKIGANLAKVQTSDMQGLVAFEQAITTGTGTRIKTFFTKALTQGPLSGHLDRFEALADVALDLRDTRFALKAVQRDLALHQFARAFLPRYAKAKQLRGWLDFDDLIDRAAALLSDEQVAQWVLYRLDGGIDHILVDEAQDTSPKQWRVIERLAQEITSGQGARDDVRRTIFVVGDKKQSIYSFQGADAAEFDRMRAEFSNRLAGSETPLAARELAYSFRSAAPILSVVDHTFAGRDASGFTANEPHKAFHAKMPGRVDLWPEVPQTGKDKDDRDWFDPVDHVSDTHHTVVLADRIARFISGQIGQPMPEQKDGTWFARPIHAGDFLILVRGRKRLFQEIIRACKQHGLPIAGADRLKVMQELAVRDVAALLAFLATPEDSLSLATALRSPLFGIDENTLFSLTHYRKSPFLWEDLRKRDDIPTILTVLNDLLGQTDFLRPYDMIERILTKHQGRRKLVGRLGEEAEDGLDALLSQALSYEQTEVPSLTGFLEWMQTDELEITRQADAAGGRIRVMTVHGAKGLEAPIVILPDCAKPKAPKSSNLVSDDTGVMWPVKKAEQPPRQRDVLEDKATAAARERDRLLYVAMTRAERWLVVAAHEEKDTEGTGWYAQARTGLSAAGGTEFDFPDGAGLRLEAGQWTGLEMQYPEPPAAVMQVTPDWLDTPVAPQGKPAKPLSPSDLGGAKALPGDAGDDSEIAMRRGTLVHLLLEHLPSVPPTDREMVSLSILADAMQDEEGLVPDDLLAEAIAVMDADGLAWVFDGTRAEVAIQGEVGPLGAMSGIIDRLHVTDTTVRAVDFKTNRVVPDTAQAVPEGVLRQLGAYADMLQTIFPDRAIELHVCWTANADLMRIPHDLVRTALNRAYLERDRLDAGQGAS